MRFGVNIAKTNNGAFGGRLLQSRPPIGLNHETHCAGPSGGQMPVEQFFRGDAPSFRLEDFFITKFFFKPGDHPVASENFHLGIVASRDRRRIRRHPSNGLEVGWGSGLHRGGGSETQASCGRVEDTGAKGFASFVRSAGHYGKPLRQSGLVSGGCGNTSQDRTRWL